MACPGYTDDTRYTHTEFVGCAAFDLLYPGPLIVPPPPPPSPPGVPPVPPLPPRYAFEVEEFLDCAGFDALYPGPNLGTVSAPIYEFEVSTGSDTCADQSICCGCPCCRCNGYWTAYTFTLSGLVGVGSCENSNGDYTMTGGPECLWSNGPGIPPLSDTPGDGDLPGDITPMALPNSLFTCEPAVWSLVVGGCRWEVDHEDFDCATGGTLTLVTPLCCGGSAPATVTLTPAGTWVSCGEEEPAGPMAVLRTPTAPTAPRRRSLPCVHLGDDLTHAEREERKLGHYRTWKWCDHPARPLGEAVCGCRGCGPRCRGYEAADPGEEG